MRDFAGGVLIGAERGVFVAAPAGEKMRGTLSLPTSTRNLQKEKKKFGGYGPRQRRYSGSRLRISASGFSTQARVT